MEDVVLTLETLRGVRTGIRTDKMRELYPLVLGTAKASVPGNRPMVGGALFNIEAGIIVGWVEQAGEEHIAEYMPFTPDIVGQCPVEVVCEKDSGVPTVEHWLEKLDIKLSDEEKLDLVKRIKEKAFEQKGLPSVPEFEQLLCTAK